jgi:acetylornithine deacetylase/succinyl-diaminopimelate desuccinylase-like protein
MNKIVEDTCDLIRLNTTNSLENEIIAAIWVKERTEKFGMQVEMMEVFPNRTNCIAEYNFGPGPTFVLCTHLDVVPALEKQFYPTVIENRIYGRGACDAKGALAAMIDATERSILNFKNLAGKLIIAAVVDEEVGASGAQHLLATGFNADAVIIGEPTSNKVLLKSRGVIRAKMIITGTSGHASRPDESINAISAASLLINQLDLLNGKLIQSDQGACAVTMVNGGTAVNVIPDQCEIVIDRRVAPNVKISTAEKELDLLIQDCLKHTGARWNRYQAGVNVHPLNVELDSNFAKQISSIEQLEIGNYFPAVTDAPHFAAAGIQTAIFGPGNIDQAHTENEWVDIQALFDASEMYYFLIQNFLKNNNSI